MPTSPDLTGHRILLLEDEILIRLDMGEQIAETGATLLEAGTVAEAIDALDGTMPDAAVLDVNLPDGPCWPVADRLRAAHVPFALHSGDEAPRGAEAHAPDAPIMMKPGNPGTVITVLRGLLT